MTPSSHDLNLLNIIPAKTVLRKKNRPDDEALNSQPGDEAEPQWAASDTPSESSVSAIGGESYQLAQATIPASAASAATAAPEIENNLFTLLLLAGAAVGSAAVFAGGKTGAGATADTAAPSITSVAINGASGVQNSSLNAGDIVSITITLSEATTVTTTGGTPQLALDIGGTIVQANYASGSGSTALVFSYTVLAGQTDANGISLAANGLSLNGATLKDAAGNNATLTHATVADDAAYMVVTIAPNFSSAATATIAENTPTSSSVYDATADGDVGVNYTLTGADAALFNIAAATGLVTFNARPDFEVPLDAGADNVYDFNVTATDAANNATSQAVQLTVTDVVVEAGNAVIDLGSYGLLIAPVQVEGKWYYYWDRSGDGTYADNVGSLNGGRDWTTHDQLDLIFKYASDFTTENPTYAVGNAAADDTTDTYRFATINGVKLALPTVGGESSPPYGAGGNNGLQPGTAVSLNTTENNATYNDLLAVWDAYNGTGTGPSLGVPPGWKVTYYWSATPSPSASRHSSFGPDWGYVYDDFDSHDSGHVALQVL